MKVKPKVILLGLGLILLSLSALSLSPSPVSAEEAPVRFRGENYITLTYPNNTVTWQSAPANVFNGTHWVDYIFQDLYESDGKYVVQAGTIGAEIYDYYAKFYTPDLTEVRLYDERWEVQRWKTAGKGSWDDLGAQSGTPTFSVSEGDEDMNITKAFHSWAGWLNITYSFQERLKHTVTFTSEIETNTTFRVLQIWAGIVGGKVRVDEGNITTITTETILSGTDFRFLDNATMSVEEDQLSMADYLQPVAVDVHAQGMKCDFIFDNWTLANGETLDLDPATWTKAPPYVGGWASRYWDGYESHYSVSTTDNIKYYYYGEHPPETYEKHGFCYWNISSLDIPNLNVSQVQFQYTCTYKHAEGTCYRMNNPYEGQSAQQLWDDADSGSGYYSESPFPETGTHTVTLEEIAETNIEDQASGGWFGLGLDGPLILGTTTITKSTATLIVTFTPNAPTIGEFQAPSTVYGYQEVALNATVDDQDGIADFKNASLTLSVDSVELTWVNNTNTFGMTDPNNKWELVSGTRTSVNSTAYKLTWTVKAYWNSTEGYVSITEAVVWDSNPISGNNSESTWFYNENDLIISSASVDDSRVNPSDTLSFDGQIYYQGTSTPPKNGLSALSFDGNGDYVQIANDNSIDFTTEDFTLSAWIKPVNISNYPYIFHKGAWSTAGYMFQVYNTGMLYFGTNVAGDYNATQTATGLITLNNWHYVTAVRNGTIGKIYVNGTDRTSSSESISNLSSSSAYPLYVSVTGGTAFNGTIDEPRIYNRALTQTEINDLYQGIYNDTGLVLYQDFDGDTQDKSGTANHGTRYGDTTWVTGKKANLQARVELSGTLKQTLNVIEADGSFAIPVTAESSCAQHSYNVYSLTSKVSVQNQTLNVVVDRIVVYWEQLNDSRVDINTNIEGRYKAVLDYDDHVLGSGDSLSCSWGALTWDSGDSWWDLAHSEASVVSTTIAGWSGTEATYGITTITENITETSYIYDRLNITSGGVSDGHCDYGSTETVWFKIYYAYDNTAFTDTEGTVYFNGSSATWDSGDNRWEKDYTYSAVIAYEYVVSSITDTQYGLSTLNDSPGAQQIIWDRVSVNIDANVTNPDAGDYIESIITGTYEYDSATVTSWTINILRNSTHYATGNFTDHEDSETAWQYTTENITETTYGLTSFTTNTLTVIWGNLFIEIDQITVDDSRININTNAVIHYHCRFSSNQSSCTAGTLTVNSTGYSINGTGWVTVQKSEATVTQKTFTITSVDVNGETDWGQLPADPTVIWDRVEIYFFSTDDNYMTVNDNVEVRVKARLDWDNHPLGAADSLYINGSIASWDSINSWFEASLTNGSVCNVTFSVSSASEGTYSISSLYHSAAKPWAVWDQLIVYDLQTVQFLGGAKFRYTGRIQYDYSDSPIDGATLRFKYPNSALSTTFTSNSSGWFSFTLTTDNATQTGIHSIYGVMDGTYGVTHSGANQTFLIRSLTVNTDDANGDSIGSTTLKVYNGSTLVNEPSVGATVNYPQTVYNITAYWLESIPVNTTALTLNSNTNIDLNCSCYPFTISGATYHVASNATISNTSWSNTTMREVIEFSCSVGNYTLVSSYSTEPTYVLNCSYDVDSFTSYLSISHDGNYTITISYETSNEWMFGTRVHRTDHRIENVTWNGNTLTLILEGTSNETGTLEVYCGTKGAPSGTTGLIAPQYTVSTRILEGQYNFGSQVTASVVWSTSGDGGVTPGIIAIVATDIDLDRIQQGTSRSFNATITWSGMLSIMISQITFSGEGSEWLEPAIDLPYLGKAYSRGTQPGSAPILLKLSIPPQASLGDYAVNIEYTVAAGTYKSYKVVASLKWTVVATPVAPGGVPAVVTGVLLAVIIAVFVKAFWKK